MSAINIPDMVTVMEAHNLVVVPIDLHVNTLAMKIDELEEAITEYTVAILPAQIYGRRNSIDPIITLARAHGLCVIEDLAEAYDGVSYCGHPLSDLSFFSFGTIKFSTCLGGGVGRVRDEEVYDSMREIERTYPVQSTRVYAKKLVKVAPVWGITNIDNLTRLLFNVVYTLKIDHSALIVKLVRGFPKEELLQNLRQQPCVSLLVTMRERVKRFDTTYHKDFTTRMKDFVNSVPGLNIPGRDAEFIDFWLFPILVNDPQRMAKALQACGIDATVTSTQLRPLPTPDPSLTHGRVFKEPTNAIEMMKKVLYLPMTKKLHPRELPYVRKVLTHSLAFVEGGGAVRSKL